ncbi:beta-ketoacyl synthase chain length factor [Dyadobacter tibetensis]|uniref:beta-ketoacyl synthase chain length factor n=1 Tax=Dyadobacter tibetensis TaxID=1211851 RepID=UPI00046E75DF|nr:beta-ketoacyl synthase chain length factor [Dyadobacter tibetensis]
MVYINDTICISAQRTTESDFFSSFPLNLKGNRFFAIEPNYMGLIPSSQLRRMGRALRMGVGAGLTLAGRWSHMDGIILATANGGLDDCLKFLNQIVDYAEGTLTPTNFVQSTPNAVAGSLALITKTTGYNITHVHHGLAFENALQDAALRLDLGESKRLLLGAVDEISDYNYNIDWLKGSYKKEPVDSQHLLDSATKGTVCGEGATWFVLEQEKSEQSLAQIADVQATSYMNSEGPQQWILDFLRKNQMTVHDLDAIILGFNGDQRTDTSYQQVYDELFAGKLLICYKQWTGEYPTAVAFGTWLGVQLLKEGRLPEAFIRNGELNSPCRHILIYNQYQGFQHGLQLLKAV